MATKTLTDVASIGLSRKTRDLANSELIEETGSSHLIRTSIYTALLVVSVFFVWAYYAAIQEIIQSDGIVVPRDEVRVIQHLEGGILSEVLVKPGQMVEAGDILARLDGSTAQGQLAQNDSRLISLMLEEERFRAFSENRTPDFTSVVSGYEALKSDQIRLFEAEQTAKSSQISVVEKQVLERRSELAGVANERRNLSKQMEILDDEFKIQKRLYEDELSPRLNFLNAQQSLLSAQGTLQQIKDREQTLTASVVGLQERRNDIEKQLRQDALRRLGDIVVARAEIEKNTASLQDRVDRLVVRAPVSGLVQDVPLRANSGVLPPGGVVAEVVPISGGFLVECRITTRDIGFLAVDQSVTVKVNAFDYARYGAIPGKLLSISPSTFLDNNNNPYYLAKIELSKNYVGEDPDSNLILPGMTIQADITTGRKTIFEYLLKPLYTVVNEAFWER